MYGSFKKGIIIGKCKTKVIQTDLSTFRHNQGYPGITQAYSGIFKTLAYLERWYFQNPSIFRTPVYSERWHIQNPRHTQNPVKHLT